MYFVFASFDSIHKFSIAQIDLFLSFVTIAICFLAVSGLWLIPVYFLVIFGLVPLTLTEIFKRIKVLTSHR